MTTLATDHRIRVNPVEWDRDRYGYVTWRAGCSCGWMSNVAQTVRDDAVAEWKAHRATTQ